MTSIKDLPQETLIVLLASRFDLNEGGHFYWYTKEIVSELNLHHPKFLVLSPPIDPNSLPDFVDSRWVTIEDFPRWGNDIGTLPPRKLVKKIVPILGSIGSSKSVVILSLESSFSMIVALLEIQRKLPDLKVSITMLDHGFWLKFLSTRLPIVNLLVRRFITNLANAQNSFKLLHPSLSQVESFSKLIGFKISPFSHISAFWKYSDRKLDIDHQQVRLLVLPWSVDLDHVIDFVNSSSLNIGTDFKMHIHFKNQNDLNYFRENLGATIFSKVQHTAGVLSLDDYISQFKRSDLAWIPYTDFYHQITGSGRAFDCLALGCPLVIDEKSDLALMTKGFPLIYLCPNADTNWISKFIVEIKEERIDFNNYLARRTTLENLGVALFSPSNGINSFLEPIDVTVEKDKSSFSVTDFLLLEVLYFFGYNYSKLQFARRRLQGINNFFGNRLPKSSRLSS